MNEQEFEKQLNALHDRVLSKALSDEEKNNYTESLFESIRHVNKYGQEFWYARDLQIALGYTEWRNFCKVIEKAKEACRGSNNAVSDHFVDVNKIVMLVPPVRISEIFNFHDMLVILLCKMVILEKRLLHLDKPTLQ